MLKQDVPPTKSFKNIPSVPIKGKRKDRPYNPTRRVLFFYQDMHICTWREPPRDLKILSNISKHKSTHLSREKNSKTLSPKNSYVFF